MHVRTFKCGTSVVQQPLLSTSHTDSHMQCTHTYVCVYVPTPHRDHSTCMLLCYGVWLTTAPHPLSQVVPYVQPLPRGVRGVSASVGIENAESTPVHEVILRQQSDEELTEKVCEDNQQLMILMNELCMYVCMFTPHSHCNFPLQASGEGVSDLSAEVVQDDQATPSVVVPEGGGGLMAFITPAPHGTLQPICPKCEVCTYEHMHVP